MIQTTFVGGINPFRAAQPKPNPEPAASEINFHRITELLRDKRPMGSGQVAAIFKASHARVSQNLRRLVAKGLVTRYQVPGQRGATFSTDLSAPAMINWEPIILAHVAQHPGQTISQISQAVGHKCRHKLRSYERRGLLKSTVVGYLQYFYPPG